MILSLTLVCDQNSALSGSERKRGSILTQDMNQAFTVNQQEDFSEYVAHLQVHMALQARNLVPTYSAKSDSREELLHQTQANFEKFVSRQAI